MNEMKCGRWPEGPFFQNISAFAELFFNVSWISYTSMLINYTYLKCTTTCGLKEPLLLLFRTCVGKSDTSLPSLITMSYPKKIFFTKTSAPYTVMPIIFHLYGSLSKYIKAFTFSCTISFTKKCMIKKWAKNYVYMSK